MEIKHIKCDKASYMLFENIYDERELELIWQEAYFLCHEDKLLPPLKSGTAFDSEGNPLKSNKCIWINEIYKDMNLSNYGKLYKKPISRIIANKKELKSVDINLKLFFETNNDSTLMSYYENSDYYEAHHDKSCYTYVFWLFKEPKLFSGGDLTFTELSQTIKVKSNMAVLFPSWLDHKVDKIEMYDTIEKFKCNGRFAFTTFYNIAFS